MILHLESTEAAFKRIKLLFDSGQITEIGGLRILDIKKEEARLRVKLSGRRLQDSDVEDIIQETFLRALKAVGDGTIKRPEEFGGYLSRVCDFVLYEKFREPSRWHLDVDAIGITNEQENLEQQVLDKERRKRIEEVLATLRDKDRKLLRAKIFEELDTDEICEKFGISRANLRVVLHRAVQRFVKACRKVGIGDVS